MIVRKNDSSKEFLQISYLPHAIPTKDPTTAGVLAGTPSARVGTTKLETKRK